MKPNDEEIKQVEWLLKELKRSEDFCRPYFERGKRHYQLYRFASSVKSSAWPYTNRARSRDVLAFVEDTTALMIQTLFATMPFFSVIPRESNRMMDMYQNIDPIRIGKQLEKLIDYQVSHEETEFFEEMVDYFKSGGIMGNSYIGVYPKFQADGSYLRPLLRMTDFWDCLPVPAPRRLSRSRGMFNRNFMTIGELQDLQQQGIYYNVDQIKDVGSGPTGSGDTTKWHQELLEEVGMQDYQMDDNDIEIFDYISGGHVMTFANRKTVIRDSTVPKEKGGQIKKPYPYNMPLVQYKYMPVPMEFFAMGIPEVLEVLQEDKNLVRSARRDNIDLIINKVLKVRNHELNPDMFKCYPGALWYVDNLNDIEEMEMTDVTQSSYREEDTLRFDMENALSLFGYARGQTPQHSEQPNTVMKLQQASLNRTDLAIKMAEFTTLQNIAARMILLARRFMNQADYESIVGEKDAGFYQLEEEHIRRFYIVKPIGSSVSHIKEVRQQQIQYAIDTVMKFGPDITMNPQINPEPFRINLKEIFTTALEAADIKNIDRIIEPMQPPQGPMDPMAMGMPNPVELEALMNVPYGGGM